MKKILLILLVVTFSSSAFADPKMELGLGVYNNKAQCGVCHNCLLLNDTILSSALGLKHQSVTLLQTNKPRTKIPKSFFIFSFYFFLLFFPSNLGSSLLCGL